MLPKFSVFTLNVLCFQVCEEEIWRVVLSKRDVWSPGPCVQDLPNHSSRPETCEENFQTGRRNLKKEKPLWSRLIVTQNTVSQATNVNISVKASSNYFWQWDLDTINQYGISQVKEIWFYIGGLLVHFGHSPYYLYPLIIPFPSITWDLFTYIFLMYVAWIMIIHIVVFWKFFQLSWKSYIKAHLGYFSFLCHLNLCKCVMFRKTTPSRIAESVLGKPIRLTLWFGTTLVFTNHFLACRVIFGSYKLSVTL